MKTPIAIQGYLPDEPNVVLVWLPVRIPSDQVDALFEDGNGDRDAAAKILQDATADALARTDPGVPNAVSALLLWWARRMEHRG